MSGFEVGVSNPIYATPGDDDLCPGCYGRDTVVSGQLSANGTLNDIRKCNSCNRLFVRTGGGYKQLVEEAAAAFNTKNVGITSAGVISSSNSYGSSSANPNFNNGVNGSTAGTWYNGAGASYVSDTETNSKLQNIESKLQNIEYSSQITSDYLRQLLDEIRGLLKQNGELMEKLASDPLVGVRKAVSEFNLK